MKGKNKKHIKDLILQKDHVVGLRETIREIKSDTVECVIVALNSDEFILSTIIDVIGDKNITVLRALTGSELAKICKIDVSVAVVGIKKEL